MFFEHSGRVLPLSEGHSLDITATQSRSDGAGPDRATFRNTSYDQQLLMLKFLLPSGSGLSASHRSPTFIWTLHSCKFFPMSEGHSLRFTATQSKFPGAFVVVEVVVVVVLLVVLVVGAEP